MSDAVIIALIPDTRTGVSNLLPKGQIMNQKNLKAARQVMAIARELIASSDYIYDPKHEKHPGGGYHQTEKGWSKVKEQSDGDKAKPKTEGGRSGHDAQKKRVKSLYESMNSVYKESESFWDWDKFTTPENRETIASLSGSELRKFKSDMENVDGGMTHPFVREAYAQNPNEDEQELYNALMDEDLNVPLFVVQNKNCPNDILEAIATGDESALPEEFTYDYIQEDAPEIISEAKRHLEARNSGGEYSPAYTRPIY